MWIHRVSGLVIVGLTLAYGGIAIQRLGTTIKFNLHCIIGFIIFLIAPAIAVFGFIAR